MNLKKWKSGLLAAGFATAALPLAAQDNSTNPFVPETTAVPQVSTSATSAFGTSQRLSEVLNRNIVLSNGQIAGQITDAVLGPRGNVEFLIGSTQTGASDKQSFPIPMNALQLNNEGQAQLNMTPQQFQQVPTFNGNELPNFQTPQFQNQLMTAFRPALPVGGNVINANGTNSHPTAVDQPVQNPAYTGGSATNAPTGGNQTSAAQSNVTQPGTNQSRIAQTGAAQANQANLANGTNQTSNQNGAAQTGPNQTGNNQSAAQRNGNQISTNQNNVQGGNPNGVQNNSAATAQQAQLNGTSNTNAGTSTPSDRSVTSQNAAQQRNGQIGGISGRNPARPVLPNTTPLTPNNSTNSAAQTSPFGGGSSQFGNVTPRVGSPTGIRGANGVNANGIGVGAGVRSGVGNAGIGGTGVGNASPGGTGVGNAGTGGAGVGNAGVGNAGTGGAGVGNAGGTGGK